MLTVLAEGEGFVAIAKPAGRIVVPGRGAAADETPLSAEVAAELGRRVWVVHRLDRGTSGVLVLATDPGAHRWLSRAFERHLVTKRYFALCRGTLVGGGEIDRPLVAVRGGRTRVAHPDDPADAAVAKPSRTRWRALERIGDFTAVEAQPVSGRLHQIRAHLAVIGHPLAVDPDYARVTRLTVADLVGPAHPDAAAVVLTRTPLHAGSLKLPATPTAPSVTIEAPLPADLTRLLGFARACLAGRPVRW